MPRKSVEDQPSTTAFFTALRRALIYLENDGDEAGKDNLAIHFLPPHYRFLLKFNKVRTNTLEKLDTAIPGMNAYILARTGFFDNLFIEALQNDTPQVVLLGAGYDTRAYRFASLIHNSRIFELDINPTQERKKACLRKAHIEIPSQVKLVPVNFNQEKLGEVLVKAGYRKDEKTLFLWEGVSYYLDPESVSETLGFVTQTAMDSKIAFDYIVRVPDKSQDQVYGFREFDHAMQDYHKNEELMFLLNEGEIGRFLEQNGLRLVHHLSNNEIEKIYLTNEDGVVSGHITGLFRFAVASPRG